MGHENCASLEQRTPSGRRLVERRIVPTTRFIAAELLANEKDDLLDFFFFVYIGSLRLPFTLFRIRNKVGTNL